ncbi:hypothetical protein S245_023335, partial [Arachis hypogaea]
VFNSKIDEGRKTLQTGKYKWQTYKEVYEVIQKVGSSIRSCGYRQEKKCGIYGANCAGWIISMEHLWLVLSFEMVRKFKPPLMKLLESSNIDLCFANQDEATELLRNGTYSQEQGRNAAAHKPGHSQSGEHSNAEAIHNFHIPSCVAIDDVIQVMKS